MLRRLSLRKNHSSIIRYFADKSGENDTKPPASESEKKQKSDTKTSDATQKIQELLKSMMVDNQNRETLMEEQKAKITTAPGIYRKRKPEPDIIQVKEEKIDEKLTTAVSQVAEALGGDVKQTESELLNKVLGKVTQSPTNLSDLIVGMKIDRSKAEDSSTGQGPPQLQSRGQQVKRLVARAKDDVANTRFAQRRDQPRPQREQREKRTTEAQYVDLFNAEPLGIFTKREKPDYGTKLETWEALEQRELKLSVTQPPSNYFQKLIQWTEQGKLWKFPINNEQGLDEEQNVHFSEHVFLEQHLEDWCPTKGPIRHFMELVCVGLSKNAFYTAEEKKEHILWYKQYFLDKKGLLEEIGAMGNVGKSGKDINV